MVGMERIIEQILVFVVAKGAIGVFLASVLEEVIVPIPSTIIQTGAGFLFLSGHPVSLASVASLVADVAFPAALGATVGSLVVYGLVFFGQKLFIDKFGRYFMLSSQKVDRAKEYVLTHKSLLWAFFIVRFVPILPSVFVSAAAGLVRLPFRVYFLTTFFGMFVRGLYLGFAGWMSGTAFHSVSKSNSVAGMFLWFALGVLAISLITMMLVLYVKKSKKDTTV